MVNNKKNNPLNNVMKIYVFLLLILLVSPMVLSQETNALKDQGVGQLGEEFTITQACGSASYITLSSIQYPNRTTVVIDQNMTYVGGITFEYDFNNTNTMGRYDVVFYSDGCEETGAVYFTINATGENPSASIYLLFTIILLVFFIILIFFQIKYSSEKRELMKGEALKKLELAKDPYTTEGNMMSAIMSLIGLAMVKSFFFLYYLWASLFLFLLFEFSGAYGVNSLYNLSSIILSVVIWGFIPAILILFVNLLSIIFNAFKELKEAFT